MKCPSPTVSPNVSASWTSLVVAMPGETRMDLPSVASYTPLPLSMIGIPMRLALSALLVTLTTAAPALDWDYDKQLHAAGAALGSYVICDTLERKTDLSPWKRMVIATATMTAVGWLHEETMGVRDPGDAQASTIGAIGGAILQTGVSFTCRRDSVAAGLSWNF